MQWIARGRGGGSGQMMLRIAAEIARRVHARALVTGDAVGQVASQTLENLAAIQAATSMLVFRPLVGMDKEEITASATRLGTYPISIIPDEDCCTLFTPRHPVTRARVQDVEKVERGLPTHEMITAALSAAVLERVSYPVVQSAVES